MNSIKKQDLLIMLGKHAQKNQMYILTILILNKGCKYIDLMFIFIIYI